MHLAHVDVNTVLQDLPRPPAELAAELGMSEIDVVEQILTERINDKFGKLEQTEELSRILGVLVGAGAYRDASSRVLLKKKMLFLLCNAPDVDWDRPSSLGILSFRLSEGLNGRCPDGISSFCDQFMLDLHFQRHSEILKELPTEVGRLIIAVTTFIYHYKMLFMKKHMSRHREHYEGRTAADVVLRDMLMLPLSLPGIYSEVKYPSFAREGHVDANALDSDAVCERFVKGGDIEFTYGETVTIPPLTLRALIDSFKTCIVKETTGISAPSPEPNNDLLLAPRLNFTIDEDILLNFVKSDLAIGPFYEAAKETGFSVENAYFNPMHIGNEVTEDSTKPFAVQVLKDRAFLRILNVCKYVKVPDDFEAKASSSWELAY